MPEPRALSAEDVQSLATFIELFEGGDYGDFSWGWELPMLKRVLDAVRAPTPRTETTDAN